MTYTAKGKLYARMVYRGIMDEDASGARKWPDEVPAENRDETWDAYTNFYQYQPPIDPPEDGE